MLLESKCPQGKNYQNSQVKISRNKLHDAGESCIAYLWRPWQTYRRRTNREFVSQRKEHSWLQKKKQLQRHNSENLGSTTESQMTCHGQDTGSEEGRQRPNCQRPNTPLVICLLLFHLFLQWRVSRGFEVRRAMRICAVLKDYFWQPWERWIKRVKSWR